MKASLTMTVQTTVAVWMWFWTTKLHCCTVESLLTTSLLYINTVIFWLIVICIDSCRTWQILLIVMCLFVLMCIELRVYRFYWTSHLHLGPNDSFYHSSSLFSLVCAMVRSASRSADILSWAFIHLRSLFSTMGSVVLALPCLPTFGLL